MAFSQLYTIREELRVGIQGSATGRNQRGDAFRNQVDQL
jgi:hypothetical protein